MIAVQEPNDYETSVIVVEVWDEFAPVSVTPTQVDGGTASSTYDGSVDGGDASTTTFDTTYDGGAA